MTPAEPTADRGSVRTQGTFRVLHSGVPQDPLVEALILGRLDLRPYLVDPVARRPRGEGLQLGPALGARPGEPGLGVLERIRDQFVGMRVGIVETVGALGVSETGKSWGGRLCTSGLVFNHHETQPT